MEISPTVICAAMGLVLLGFVVNYVGRRGGASSLRLFFALIIVGIVLTGAGFALLLASMDSGSAFSPFAGLALGVVIGPLVIVSGISRT